MSRPQPQALALSNENELAAADVNYEFPCVQGFQSGDFYWMATLTFHQAKTLFQPFFDRVVSDNPLDLAQRTLDRKRSQKFADYMIRSLATGQPYIMPPIIVSLDIPADACYDFAEIELDGLEIETLGILSVPLGTTFWIPDGQHRAFGSILALMQAPGLVGKETFGVSLIPDASGQKRQQFFVDINQNGMKPNKSILSLLNCDEYSEIARGILVSVPVFRDRTSLEATNVKPKSCDFFTMNALRDSCQRLVMGYEGDRQARAIEFWGMVAAYHPNWQKVGDDGLTLRQSTISFLALTLNAIAIVGNQQGDQNEWLTKLGLIDWSATNPEWDGLIRFGQRIVKNSHTTKALAEYIATQTGAL